MRDFRFSFGNSSKGSIGGVIVVNAETEVEALQKAKSELALHDTGIEVDVQKDDGIEYFEVYTNSNALTLRDLEEREGKTEEVPRDNEIRDLFNEQYVPHNSGDPSFMIDDDCEISEGSDNGAYVQIWAWVDFNGTKLDKENNNANRDGGKPA